MARGWRVPSPCLAVKWDSCFQPCSPAAPQQRARLSPAQVPAARLARRQTRLEKGLGETGIYFYPGFDLNPYGHFKVTGETESCVWVPSSYTAQKYPSLQHARAGSERQLPCAELLGKAEWGSCPAATASLKLQSKA